MALGRRRGAGRRRIRRAPADLPAGQAGLAPRPGRSRTSEMTTPALELVAVGKSFGRTEIIRSVSLRVPTGQRHAIIGPNGAGKSTLFNLISGRLAPTSGSVLLNGEDVTGLPPFKVNRRGLSRSFQVTHI